MQEPLIPFLEIVYPTDRCVLPIGLAQDFVHQSQSTKQFLYEKLPGVHHLFSRNSLKRWSPHFAIETIMTQLKQPK